MIIQLMLLFALGVYTVVDHLQTVALVNVGYGEANPVVLFLIGDNMQWDNLLVVKIGLVVFCGLLIIANDVRKKR